MGFCISRVLLDAVLADARADPLHERCGLLLGDGQLITSHRPTANVSAHPATRFEIDPAALIAAHRAARDGGPAIIGHYHSHPDGATTPSLADAADVREFGKLWLIISNLSWQCWISHMSGSISEVFNLADLQVREPNTPLPALNSAR